MDFEKAVKNAKWFAVGIFVIAIINICLLIATGMSTTLTVGIGLAQLILIIVTIEGLNKSEMYGAVCGIILSILLILTRDILSLIFGILYLIDCIKLVNYMKEN